MKQETRKTVKMYTMQFFFSTDNYYFVNCILLILSILNEKWQFISCSKMTKHRQLKTYSNLTDINSHMAFFHINIFVPTAVMYKNIRT